MPFGAARTLLVLSDARVDQHRQAADAQDEALDGEQHVAAVEVDMVARERRRVRPQSVEGGAGQQEGERQRERIDVDDAGEFRTAEPQGTLSRSRSDWIIEDRIR